MVSSNKGDVFKEWFGRANALHNLSENPRIMESSADPTVKAHARQDLLGAFNASMGRRLANADIPNEQLYYLAAKRAYILDRKNTELFRDRAGDLISEARSQTDAKAEKKRQEAIDDGKHKGEPVEAYHKWGKNWLKVQPIKIEGSQYEPVVREHIDYRTIEDAKRDLQLGANGTADRAAFVERTAGVFGRDLERTLMGEIPSSYDVSHTADKDEVSDLRDEISDLANALTEMYASSPAERALVLASETAGIIKKRLETAVPVERRPDYVETILKEGVEVAKEVFDKDRAKGRQIYKDVSRSMYEASD